MGLGMDMLYITKSMEVAEIPIFIWTMAVLTPNIIHQLFMQGQEALDRDLHAGKFANHQILSFIQKQITIVLTEAEETDTLSKYYFLFYDLYEKHLI